jgi:transcription initiation factor IIE alpha subunit
MFSIIILIIIILFTLYLVYSKLYKNDNLVLVMSDLDDQYYWVRDKYDKINAANTLAKIKQNIIKLIDYLKVNIDKFPENMSYIKDMVSRTKIINI